MPNRSIAFVIAVTAIALGGIAFAGLDTQTTKVGRIFRDCSDCPEMVEIPAGGFLMGSSIAETKRDLDSVPKDERDLGFSVVETFLAEHPQHTVTIPQPFGIGRHLVTRGEFAAFARETGNSIAGCTLLANHRFEHPADAGWQSPGFAQTDRDPVVCVNWHDAHAYVTWLNSKLHPATALADDGPYRLPSEAEWEYAARAGTKTARWWGDDIGSGNADCEGCGSQWDDKQPAPVGSFRVNPFGLFDVLGSAWEWTEDCWHKTYDEAPLDGSAWTTGKSCEYHVIRGGSFASSPWTLRAAKRGFAKFNERGNDLGFRVVKTLQ